MKQQLTTTIQPVVEVTCGIYFCRPLALTRREVILAIESIRGYCAEAACGCVLDAEGKWFLKEGKEFINAVG